MTRHLTSRLTRRSRLSRAAPAGPRVNAGVISHNEYYHMKVDLLGLVIGAVLSSCQFFCGDEVQASIGAFKERHEAEVASIQRVSREIRRCPNAQSYRIVWKVKADQKETYFSTLCTRSKDGEVLIGYEADPSSGFSKFWKTNDSAIHIAAEKGEGFDAFETSAR